MCDFSTEDFKFLVKLNKGSTNFNTNFNANFNTNVKLAYNKLNLNDKKRCCLIASGFTLDHFNTQHVFETRGDEINVKYQWFHSAIAIYTLLSNPNSAPQKSFINAILSTGTEKIFINIARDVLNSDPDGVRYMKLLDTKTEIYLTDGKDEVQINSSKPIKKHRRPIFGK